MGQLTPGLISSLPETAGLPPFISSSTSYPELALSCAIVTSPHTFLEAQELPERFVEATRPLREVENQLFRLVRDFLV
jgi:hypothetical protein